MKLIRLIVVTCLWSVLPSAAVAQTIVWTDVNARKIQRKDVSGGEVQTIVQFPSSSPAATLINYDPITAKLYYISGTSFQRSNSDGSDPENVPTATVGPFALNIESRKLYWSLYFDTVLNRSELDGSGAQSHTYPVCCLTPLLALGDDLFLGGSLGRIKGIWRADADGSNEQLLHESGMPTDAAYDPVENKVYVAAVNKIYRLNPDGTGYQVVVFLPIWQSAGGPEHVAIDSHAQKLYWTDHVFRVIQRSNVDGSNVEDFVSTSDAGNPQLDLRGLTIVYNSEPIPVLSDWGLMVTCLTVLVAGLIVLQKRAGVAQ